LALNQANSDLKSKRLFEAKKQAAIAINYAPKSKEISKINKDISEKLDSVEKLFNKATEMISYARFKDIEECIEKIEKIVADKPELNQFKDMFKKTKEEYIQKIDEAREFQKSGNLKSAIENLNLAKEVCPNSEEVNELIQIISDAQSNVYSLIEKAKKYGNSADFILAEDFLRDAEKLWPTFFELEVLKDKLLKTKEEYNQKMQEARVFQESGNFEKALENLKYAKELCPNSGEVNELISIISGIKNKAIPLLENAKKYCLSAEFNLSERALNEAEQLWTQSKEIIDFRKVLEKTKKEYLFALSVAEKSLSVYKFEEAREIYKKAKKICPNSKEIDKLLDKVDSLERQRHEDIQAKENKRILKIIGLIFLFIVGAVIYYNWYTAFQNEKQRREVYRQERVTRQKAQEEEKKREEEFRLRKQWEERLARQREEEEKRKRDELARQKAEEEKRRQEELARQRVAEERRRQEELARQREEEERKKNEWPFDSTEAKRRQRKTAEELGIPIEWENSIGMEFVLIPAGRFMMGSPESEEGRRDDETLHEVTIRNPFYMSKYEVTQRQWKNIMGYNPSFEDYWFIGSELPVQEVRYADCQEFLKKLNTIDNRIYRLPTEEEWEYACRAGTNTRFYSGNSKSDLRKVACWDNYGLYTVGSADANSFGLYDMHGNVWEWCSNKIVRGGAFCSFANKCRSAYRGRYDFVFSTKGSYGFRIVFSARER